MPLRAISSIAGHERGDIHSYQVEAVTLPNVAKLAASATGALFQLTVPSPQVVSATRWNSPPMGEALTQ